MKTNMKSARMRAAIVLLVAMATGSITGMPAASAAQQAAQQPQAASQQVDTNSPKIIPSTGEDYFIGPGDVIEIKIDRAPELSGTYRVSANGTITMSFLNRVMAQQKTPEELAKFLEDSLRGRYLKEPLVSVEVKQFNSKSFFIHGSVRAPGVYFIEGRPTLLKLITMAGGLSDNHGQIAFVIRESKKAKAEDVVENASVPAADSEPNKDESDYELLRANISGLLKGNFDQNMVIEPGDIVNIPVTGMFFVTGEVASPGTFPIKEGTTLTQAISLAQGLNFDASKGNVKIFRENESTGKREEFNVDLGAVMKGKKEDILIQANDVITVPNSKFKSIGGALLSAFGMGVARRPIRY
ncbi:MAG TPA: polysaccharide biosynthesis/export family protein [Blastocatellia bacterium]|jgi:polysaccharide export outer membrane protein